MCTLGQREVIIWLGLGEVADYIWNAFRLKREGKMQKRKALTG